MTLRVNPELETLLLAETTQYAQVRVLGAALTANKRVKAKQSLESSTAQEDVWANGTLFRDAALTGPLTYAGAEIIGYGLTSDLITCNAVDLAVGKTVLRIEGGGHWVEGTLGLEGTGTVFTLPTNPTDSNSFAFSASMRLFADRALPDGTPDIAAPVVTVTTPNASPTVAGAITVTANATDDVGVTRVEFYRNSVMVLSKTGTPWTYVDNLTYLNNGVIQYSATAFDAAGNETPSDPITISVAIPVPAETGDPTPVGMELTTVTLQSTDAGAQTNVPVTFGQVFMIGALPVGNAAVELRAPNNSIIPCQLDVKASHPDGSVRHAIISALIPDMAGSSSVIYSILRKDAPLTGTAPVPANFAGLNAIAQITDNGTLLAGPQAGVIYTADAAAKLAAGTYETWLSGPIVSEWLVRVPLVDGSGNVHPHLHARLNIRAYAGQTKAKIDYIIENTWAKPKPAPVAAGTSPWELVSNVPCIYSYNLKAGDTVVDIRAKQGFARAKVTYTVGAYSGNPTGLANNATVYTTTVVIDGVTKNISVIGSANQTFSQLFATINAQLDGIGTIAAHVYDKISLSITSATTGPNSTAVISDYGTLFPAMTATKLSNNSGAVGSSSPVVIYTATITIDGSIVKNISVAGNQAQSFGQLCALLNTQMEGAATCEPQLAAPGIKFVSTTTGQSADVVVTDGTLFAITKTKNMIPFRPIRGDEHLQYPRTRWKKTFWWGAAPAVHVVHNKAYLIATKAVPNYLPTLTGSETTIATAKAEMAENDDLGQHGISKPMMGDVGYAPGIGILPEWAAMYVVNQGVDAKQTMLQQADLGGSWPMYARNYNTDMPLSFEQWPYVAFAGNTGDSKNPATGLNERILDPILPSSIPASINMPDVAHHPDFFYMPYMVTGDHYYMEGLLFHQRFLALSANPHTTYRGGRKCLWKGEQPRGIGWSIRTTMHATYIAPDGHPIKTDMLYSIAQNREWLDTNYTSPSGQYHNIFGFLHHAFGMAYSTVGGPSTGGAPWMDDFITSGVGRALELGFNEFQPFMQFKAKFPIGRLTSGSAYCWQHAAVYTMRFKQSTSSAFYSSWAEVYQGTFELKPLIVAAACGTQDMSDAISTTEGYTHEFGAMTGYANLHSGFPANMQPAVAYTAMYAGTPGSDAWLVFDSRTGQPDYNLGPQFAIVPRN